jgi:hypothetical protein
MYILLGNKGRRYLELRHKTNNELFKLYEGELAFLHRSTRGIHEAKRILNHFHSYLGEFPPTPELASHLKEGDEIQRFIGKGQAACGIGWGRNRDKACGKG